MSVQNLKLRAESRNAKLVFDDLPLLENFLRENEGSLICTLERPKKLRSLKANSYAHGRVLQALAEHTGYCVKELKDMAKAELGFVHEVRTPSGGIREIPRSSATFTSQEFSQWVDLLKYWGDLNGIYIV